MHCLRAAVSQGDNTFVSAIVWAEMRKAASYKIDISINRDGVIQESQCECGAGEGPTAHCKHVGAVLYGLTCFCQTGIVTTELTCTQVTITFKILGHMLSTVVCNFTHKSYQNSLSAGLKYTSSRTHFLQCNMIFFVTSPAG